MATAPSRTRTEGMPGVKGKNVLVTGGSSGIGQAIAVRFAEHGANVAINYLTTPDEAESTEEQVHACGHRVRQEGVRDVLVQGDVSDEDDVIIIGTGAGGGTLAHRLAPTGKRILLLERGGYLPREPENWGPRRSSSRSANSAARSGSTRTAMPSAPTSSTSSAATRSSTARSSSVCARATSTRSATTRASRRRGR